MATQPDGYELARKVAPFDAELARFVRAEEDMHRIARYYRASPHAIFTIINDIAIPGRYQTEAYARSKITGARPDMPHEQLEAEVAVRMARAHRFGKDPARVFITEKVLNLEIPAAQACWGGLLQLARSKYRNIVCRIVPDAVLEENRDGLGIIRDSAIMMTGPNAFYSEPDDLLSSVYHARELVAAAERQALPINQSLALIEQHIAQ